MRRSILLFLFAITALNAQNSSGAFPNDNDAHRWYVGTVIVPNVATTIVVPAVTSTGNVPATLFVDQINFSNVTGSAVDVTVVDTSTNCGGAACTIVPTVSVAAHTVFTALLNGSPATGGIKWSASAANAIHGNIRGRY